MPFLKSSPEFCSGPAGSKESQVFSREDLEFHKRRSALERMLRVRQPVRDPHSVWAADRLQLTARVDVPECGNPIVPRFSASDCVVSRVIDISRASVLPRVSASPSVSSSLSSALVPLLLLLLFRRRPLLLMVLLLLLVVVGAGPGVVGWWHWVGLKVGVHVHVPVFPSLGHRMHGTWNLALHLAMPIRVQTRLICCWSSGAEKCV